jgi:16S rRNA (uracil1498-N3)-methyltransferase
MSNFSYQPKIRLYVPDKLLLNKRIIISFKQSHYLINVMRKKIDDNLLIFNELCGEYLAKIEKIDKKNISLNILQKVKNAEVKNDVWVLFAPVKKTPNEYIIQKATELGVSKILPILTERTITKKLNLSRLQDIAIEASEQSERITIPEILDPKELIKVFDSWDDKRKVLYCDETIRTQDSQNSANIELSSNSPGAILVGPEGGFSSNEIKYIRQKKFVIPVNLGPRILRSDTAVVSALVIWQLFNGDMRHK